MTLGPSLAKEFILALAKDLESEEAEWTLMQERAKFYGVGPLVTVQETQDER